MTENTVLNNNKVFDENIVTVSPISMTSLTKDYVKAQTPDLQWQPQWGLPPATRHGRWDGAAAALSQADAWTAESSRPHPPRNSLEPEHTDGHRCHWDTS